MPWEGRIICPKCEKPMVEDTSESEQEMVSPMGDKLKVLHCENGDVEAEARHPVQYPYITVGQVEDYQGMRRRVIKKDIIGAEFYVFYEMLSETPVGKTPLG